MYCPLLINEFPLQVLPSLAEAIGLNEAIVLQRVHYRLNKKSNRSFFDQKYWIHNTYEQWRRQFSFWSLRTIRRTIINLEKLGILVSRLIKVCATGQIAKSYTINYGRLNQVARPTKIRHGETRQPENRLPSRNGFPSQVSFLEEEEEEVENNFEWVFEQANQAPANLRMENQDQKPGEQELKDGAQKPQSPMVNLAREADGCDLISICSPSMHGRVETENSKEEPGNQQLVAEDQLLQETSLAMPFAANSKNHEASGCNPLGRNPCDPMILAMVAIWNEVAQSKLNPGKNAYLTVKRQVLLEQFLNTALADKAREEKLDAWRDYCNRIANSRFLTGENPSGFKVTLDWALNPENAYKVLEGVIYDKPLPAPALGGQSQPWEELEQELRQSMGSQGQDGAYAQSWLQICQNLAKAVGQVRFKSWFFKTNLTELTENTAILQVESLFRRDYIESNFRFDIIRAIQAHHPTVTKLNIQVMPRFDSNDGATTQPTTGGTLS